MKAKGFKERIVRRVLRELERLNLVDDAAFARMWIDERARNRPVGSRRLREELRAKGVPEETVREALKESWDGRKDRASARRVLQQKEKLLRNQAPAARTRRLYQHLVRRGFSPETIADVLREVGDESAEEAPPT